MEEKLSEDFFSLATQYYAAGRQAVRAHLMPVGGNLLHHAVEMYLKAYLCKTISIDELKNHIRHSLPRAWDAFKNQVGDLSMDRFDSEVDELNRFENLRYPDNVPQHATTIVWSLTPDRVDIHTREGHTEQYRLNLWNIEELVETVIQKHGVNIEYFKMQCDALRRSCCFHPRRAIFTTAS